MTPDLSSIVDPATLSWRTAKKTKPMRIKHVTAVLSDMQVAASVLVRTLEGDQAVRTNAMVCVGASGEMWQQSPEKVFQKYSVVSCSSDGWFTAMPKPDRTVLACRVEGPERFHVRAQWGTRADDGHMYQSGLAGDWVLKSEEDSEDIWIVRGAIFTATYEVLP